MKRPLAVGRQRLDIERAAILLTVASIAALYAAAVRYTGPMGRQVADLPAHFHIDEAVIDFAAISPAAGTPATRATRRDTNFSALAYSLDAVRGRREVPRVFVASVPADLREIADNDRRKIAFIKIVLPLVLHVNELIANDRDRVRALQDKADAGGDLVAADVDWLENLARRHGLPRADFAALLRHVDVIPPSLAVAQAAIESGWGTSRFALEGNALFGQYTYKAEDGLLPRARDTGKSHRIRAFNFLVDGVKAYAANLNSHPAYEDFRKLRKRLRAERSEPNGYRLAATLTRYSELGEEYVRSLRTIIAANELEPLDEARLAERLTVGGLAHDDPDA
jgi:Bax protein